MAQLKSLDDLRRVIAEPRPTTKSKILNELDEQSIAFLKRCPFALVGTVSADGTLEVSPKGDEPGFIRVEDPRTLLIPERAGNWLFHCHLTAHTQLHAPLAGALGVDRSAARAARCISG